MSEKQDETTIIKFGPPLNRAYDESGAPTKAATGFAKSQGVGPEELKKGIKDGVEFVTVEKFEKGKETIDVLQALLPDIIAKIPFQKKMRWGAGTFEYARPIQWVLCLFGDVPVEFTVADVKSGNTTWCHRFLSNGQVTIGNPAEYIDTLKANYIIINEAERLETVRAGIKRIEEETKGHAIRDEELIKEIIYITEYPYPLRGSFDEAYLGIPKEVLVNVMKTHQRYIPIEKDDGQLMPYFIFFANTIPKEDKNVIRGNEKVLRARLADAQFFFEEDKKTKLADRYETLSSIVFHVKLGTLKDKTERVMAIAAYLASMTRPETRHATVAQAARLMKTDLLTHMVGEFPELQGTMGRIYAMLEGEDDRCCPGHRRTLPADRRQWQLAGDLARRNSRHCRQDRFHYVVFLGQYYTHREPRPLCACADSPSGLSRLLSIKSSVSLLDDLLKAAYESGTKITKRLTFEETKGDHS